MHSHDRLGDGVSAELTAFLRDPGDEVRWVTVGLRCARDGFTGVWADWKIDFGPTGHLLTMA